MSLHDCWTINHYHYRMYATASKNIKLIQSKFSHYSVDSAHLVLEISLSSKIINAQNISSYSWRCWWVCWGMWAYLRLMVFACLCLCACLCETHEEIRLVRVGGVEAVQSDVAVNLLKANLGNRSAVNLKRVIRWATIKLVVVVLNVFLLHHQVNPFATTFSAIARAQFDPQMIPQYGEAALTSILRDW